MIIPSGLKATPLSLRLGIIYFEHTVICHDDNKIVAVNSNKRGAILPSLSLSAIVLGPGCSVTSDAMRELSLNDCLIFSSGEYGLPVVLSSLQYRSPQKKIKQYEMVLSHKGRISAIKKLFHHRQEFIEMSEVGCIEKPSFRYIRSAEEAMGIEAAFMKKCYHFMALKYNYSWNGKNRLGLSNPLKINYCNHLTYSSSMIVIEHLGYEPDVGVLHGRSKGGGLVFDIADIFKPVLSMELSFKNIGKSNHEIRKLYNEKCNEIGLIDRLVDIIKDIME